MSDLEKEISDLRAKVEHQDECNCNLTGLEHDIRQNGIEITRVRHLVVLNDNRISENLDQIDDNKKNIDANQIEIETTIETVRLDVQSNQGNIQSITTDLNVSIF